MQTIESKLGFKFKVTTPYILNAKMLDKVQAAVDIASLKLDEKRLLPFMQNYTYQKGIYVKKAPVFNKLVGYETIKGFHVDSHSDIFNCSIEEAFEIIRAGNELALHEGPNCEANIYWKVDRRFNNSVVGYTYGNTEWQYTYQNWFNNMTPNRLAGHYTHEWLHKIGGAHAFGDHKYRKYTAVYAIGYYVGGRYVGNI